MKKLLIISEYFYPSQSATSQLFTDISIFLTKRYPNIHVITATPGGNLPPLTIHRFSSHKRSTRITSKIYKAIFFFVSSLIFTLKNSSSGDIILLASNPPFIVFIGFIVNLLKGTRFIFVFQDLFPQSASLAGILPARGVFYWIWLFFMRTCLKSSNGTIVLSNDMQACFNSEYGSDLKSFVIHNWSPIPTQSLPAQPLSKSTSKKASEWDLDDYFIVQYSGNFGRLHDIITLLEAARLLKNKKIKFLFIGNGAKKYQIEYYKEHFNLVNVHLYPYQDRSELTDSLGASDISVVSLIPGADNVVAPSKFYGILSIGRPILLIGDPGSELSRIIRENNCGIVVEPGDVSGAAKSLETLSADSELLRTMRIAAFDLYASAYGRQRFCIDYSNVLAKT